MNLIICLTLQLIVVNMTITIIAKAAACYVAPL